MNYLFLFFELIYQKKLNMKKIHLGMEKIIIKKCIIHFLQQKLK